MSSAPHHSQDPTLPARNAGVPESPVLAEGTSVGRFRIVRLAGKGGMGRVYQAWDPLLERHVALKSVLAGDGEALERFRREALALAQLNHPGICQVYDLVQDGRDTYLAMEWIEGATLDHAPSGLDLGRKLEILREAAVALDSAHAKGLVHRDLKPANLMLDPEGHLKILDFGLARPLSRTPDQPVSLQEPIFRSRDSSQVEAVLSPELPTGLYAALGGGSAIGSTQEQLTRQGSFVGSPPYASPEQIRGELAGPGTDLWSLGVVAWELIYGRHPFPGEGLDRLRNILAHRRAPVPASPRLPRRLSRLLEALLAPEPAERTGARDVARILERLLLPARAWIGPVSLAAALLLAGFLAYVFLLRGVAADLVRGRPARVAVFPAQNASGSPELDPLLRWILPELVGHGLRDSRRLGAVDPEDLQRAAARLHLDPVAAQAPDARQRIARAVGARLLLTLALERVEGGAARLRYELRDGDGRLRHQGAPMRSWTGDASLAGLAREVALAVRKAVDPLDRSPQATPGMPDLDGPAFAQYARAKALLGKGDFKGAEGLLLPLVEAHPALTMGVLDLARCLTKTGSQPPEPVFHWARMSAKAAGNRRDEVRALASLAQRLADRGELDRARGFLEEGLALSARLEDVSLEASLRSTFGTVAHRQGRTKEAREHYEAALSGFLNSEDRLAASRVLNNLAVMAKSETRFDRAEVLYRQTLTITREMADRWGEAVVLGNLGDLDLLMERHREAEGFFRQSIELRRAIGDDSGMVFPLVGMGTVCQAHGNLPQAEKWVQQGLELARRLDLRPMEGLCLYNLGELARDAGRWEEARSHYRASAEIHGTLKDDSMRGHALAGEAECLLRAQPGRLKEGQALLLQAQRLVSEPSAYLLRAEAWLNLAAGDRAAARGAFQRALVEARAHAPEIVRELSRSLAALG